MPLLSLVPTPLLVLLASYALYRLARYLLALRAVLRAFPNVPGGLHFHYTHPQFFLAPALRHYPEYDVGDYRAKSLPYQKTGTSIIAATALWDLQPTVWVADPAALKVIGGDRHLFPKQTELYDVISFYGPNLVSTEGAEWKRHRDISKAAFGEGNNLRVWRDSMRVMQELFDTLDAEGESPNGKQVDVHEIMTQLALLIISSAGFGRSIPLSYSSHTPSPISAPVPTSPSDKTASAISADLPAPGFTFPFVPALLTAVQNMNFQSIMTKYPVFKQLPIKQLELTKTAYHELREYLRKMVEETRAEMKGVNGHANGNASAAGETGGADLFKRLIKANEDEEGKGSKLSDDELLSTTYVFLLAGHETTANTLSFACALMALYPDVQAKLRAEVDLVFPGAPATALPSLDDAPESYREDMPRLKYAEATFREALRLFPAEVRLTKRAARDTTLRGTYLKTGEKYDVPVPAGSIVWLDVWAVHTMKEWWGEDADEFRPERFFDTDTYKWPRDAYMPFSLGARSCIGARFATLEGIVILSHLVKRYEICLTPEMERLSLEERRREMLSWSIGVAIQATNARVVLRRRT